MKAVSEKRLRSFFEPLLHRLQPSASKMLNEEVLISLIRVKVEVLICLIICTTPTVCVGCMNLNLSTIWNLKIQYHISKAVSYNQTRSQLNPMQTGTVYAFLILLMYATCL